VTVVFFVALVTDIVASGITAPVLSDTVPKIDPYTDCARTGPIRSKLAQANMPSARAVRNILFMRSPEIYAVVLVF
jgi:hypothetical protein